MCDPVFGPSFGPAFPVRLVRSARALVSCSNDISLIGLFNGEFAEHVSAALKKGRARGKDAASGAGMVKTPSGLRTVKMFPVGRTKNGPWNLGAAMPQSPETTPEKGCPVCSIKVGVNGVASSLL